MSSSFLSPRAALLAAALFAGASLAQAQIAFNVKVDTSALSGSVANPFYVDFQLNDGSGWGDGNNTAVISNFDFGGGTVIDPANQFGGVWGDLNSSVTLNDSTAFNEFFQGFAPGSWLSFTVSLSTNVDAGSFPDAFSFALLDSSLANLATMAPGTDSLVQLDIDGSNPSVWSFATVDGSVPQPSLVAVPEPSTYGLLGAGALLLVCFFRRRTSAV